MGDVSVTLRIKVIPFPVRMSVLPQMNLYHAVPGGTITRFKVESRATVSIMD